MDGDNRELLAAAAAGNQQSWNELVRRHNGLLWSIARSYRVPQPEDAVQNTWLRLVENLDRITDPDRLTSWLATTVRRECLQVLRRQSRGPTVPIAELPAEPTDPTPPVDAETLLAERDAALWSMVAELPERCHQLLRILMASPPPSYEAVAASLGLRVGSIGPTRQRCLESLRRSIGRDEREGSSL